MSGDLVSPEDERFDSFEAYRDGELIASGPTPVPGEVRKQAHEIRWIVSVVDEPIGAPEDEPAPPKLKIVDELNAQLPGDPVRALTLTGTKGGSK